jgi:acyl carrier protein
MSAIEEKVKEIVVDQLGLTDAEAANITPSAGFVEDLGADSLDVVEMIMKLEEEFHVIIPDGEAAQIATFGQAVEYLQKVKA